MKTKTIQKISIFVSIAVIAGGGFAVLQLAPTSAQSVQQLEGEINQLENRIQDSQDRLQELREKENTLENRLEIIRTDIDKKEAELQQTREEIAATEAEIRETERELERQKEQMQDNATTLYKEGDPSTLEMLFSSDDFSDFIDRKQYLDSVKESLDESARKVKQLQDKLQEEKATLEEKRQEQMNKKLALESRRNEQQRLLEETRGEESRYQELIAEQRDKLEEKREQQRRAYEAAAREWGDNYITTGSSGGYPWAGQGLTIGGCNGFGCVDQWRLYKGQCTSYVAWRLANEGYRVYDFGGRGNAAQWPATTTNMWANRHGQNNAAQMRSSPQAGYAAINPNLAAPYGHVMYVEQVNNDGTIRISEYNFYQPDTYSVRDVDPSGLTFLEFARQ